MSELVSTVFILFCLLQIKHMFADYFLQTPRMVEPMLWPFATAHIDAPLPRWQIATRPCANLGQSRARTPLT